MFREQHQSQSRLQQREDDLQALTGVEN